MDMKLTHLSPHIANEDLHSLWGICYISILFPVNKGKIDTKLIGNSSGSIEEENQLNPETRVGGPTDLFAPPASGLTTIPSFHPCTHLLINPNMTGSEYKLSTGMSKKP